jgi:hypothetical protein
MRFLNHEIAVGRPWEPALGAAALHRRFQEFLYRSHRTEFGEDQALEQLNRRWDTEFVRFEEIRFSPVLPAEAAVAEDWLRFTRQSLGFTYHPVTAKHETLYREFLARRYRRLETLNLAYGRLGNQAYASFSEIRLPSEAAFPRSGAPLIDWIQFVSMALPMHRNAHCFTVLIPTEPDEDLDSRRLRLARVEEVVKREKPAHTAFEVGYYWALFQIGGARLGLDTALGEGSRYVALVLGVNYLGRSYLAESHPWDVTDRTVLGRDSLKED